MENETKSDAITGATKPAEILTEEQAIAAFMGEEVQETSELTKDAEEESTEESNEEETESSEESEEEESNEETEESEGLTAASILKQLEGLDPEQIKALGKELGNKAITRFGELTYRTKTAEEELSRIKSQAPQPKAVEAVTSRFLEGIESPDQLSAKVAELKKLSKETTKVLLDHEDYGSNDLIDVGGQSYTKKQLRSLDLEVREALEEAVPSKQAEFQRLALIEDETKKAEGLVMAQVKELSDEKSEVAKTYKGLTESDLFKGIYKAFPEAKPVLLILAAHGAKSFLSKKAAAVTPATPGTKTKVNPPSSPVGVAGTPTRQLSGEKEQERLKQRAEKGSRADAEAYLASIM